MVVNMAANFKKLGFAAVLAAFAAPSAFADNPIIQTYYSPDPAPVVFGDTVCVYTGNDEGGSFFTMHGWRVSCTTDMVNWTDRGTLILQASDFNGSAKENGDWAAQVIRRNGKYYYYVTVESTAGGRAINVAVADKPEGPFKDALNGKHLAGPSWEYIDPTVWIDDDGQAYLYWGNPKLFWAKLNEDMISLVDGVHETDMSSGFSPSGSSVYTEGPWIHKRGDTYYMIYASHGTGNGGEKISYSTSSSPTGPWKWAGIIMGNGYEGQAFTDHSGIIDFKGRSFFFYHNQRGIPGAGGFSRTAAVEEFTWGADGSIPELKMTYEGVTTPISGAELNPYDRVEAETKAWVGGVEVDRAGGYTVIKHVQQDNGHVYLTNMNSSFYTKVRSADICNGADRIVVATRGNGGKMEVHTGAVDGAVLATIDVPASSDWQENSFDVTGTADGFTDLYFVVKQAGFDFDYWYLESDAEAAPQQPFHETAVTLPGVLEAEDYDKNGVGRDNKSYYDADPANQGGAYREDGVDIVAIDSTDASKGYAIGYTQAGEWMEYTINVKAAGTFDVTASVASGSETSSFQLLVDDKVVGDTVKVPKTGEDWSVYEDVKVGSVEMAAGEHVVKLLVTGALVNVDKFEFVDPNGSANLPDVEVKPDSMPAESTSVKIVSLSVVQSASSYEVFAVTGKRLGRVEVMYGSVTDALKMAGFKPGLYMVRGAKGSMMVNTAK